MGVGASHDLFDSLTKKIITVKPQDQLRVDAANSFIFAVSGARGNVSLLKGMIEKIESYPLGRNDKIVFLGDNLQAFSHTTTANNFRTIIRMLREYQEQRPGQVIILRGKDEEAFAMFKEPLMVTEYGKAIIKSYQHDNKDLSFVIKDPQPSFLNRMMLEDRRFIQKQPTYYKGNRYYFVNTGLDPLKDFDDQMVGCFMYIDELFQRSQRIYDKGVVSSCINDRPMIKLSGHRIAVGSNSTNISCVVLKDNPLEGSLDENMKTSMVESIRLGQATGTDATVSLPKSQFLGI